MKVKITNIKWEDETANLPTNYELTLDKDYVDELVEDEDDLTTNDVVEQVIYEDLPDIVGDGSDVLIEFDFEIVG
jgi:hypothetical protein